MGAGAHGDEAAAGDVEHDPVKGLERGDGAVKVQPGVHRGGVGGAGGAGDADGARSVAGEAGAGETIEGGQVGGGALVPGYAEVLDGEDLANLADLFVGLLGAGEVVAGAGDAGEVAQPGAADVHGGPEAGVEGRGEPCGAEEGARVEVRQRLGALEAGELAEVAGDVEGEEGCHDGLPGGQAGGEGGGEAADEGRAVTVASAGGSVVVSSSWSEVWNDGGRRKRHT